jgi:hypothetical protein
MGKSAPEPPDPKETSQAQTGTSVGTAIANAYLGNVNQVTPDGTLTYDQSGMHTYFDPYTGQTYEIPTFTATQTLSPEQQAVQNQTRGAEFNLAQIANQQSGRIGELLGKPLDASNAPGLADVSGIRSPQYQNFASGPRLQTGINGAGQGITKTYGTADDYQSGVKRVEDAMFERLNPQLDRQRAALESQLANQGIGVGSRAYQAAMDDYNRGANDQRTSVILGSGQEQSRLAGLDNARASFQNAAQAQGFGQNATNAQFGNDANQQMFANQSSVTQNNNRIQDQQFNAAMAQAQAQNQSRSQWMQEQFALRNQPINETTALLSGSQVTQPNFVNAQMPTIPTTDNAGIIAKNYDQKLQGWQMENQMTANILGGLFGLGGNILASDRRLKQDVKRIGTADNGLPIYSYRYKAGGPVQIGFMADEVAQIRPDAVADIGGGFLGVDYEKAAA